MQVNVLADLEELDPSRFLIDKVLYRRRAFGNEVCLAKDTQTNEQVIVKRVRMVRQEVWDSTRSVIDIYNLLNDIPSDRLNKAIGFYMDGDIPVLVFPYVKYCAWHDHKLLFHESISMLRRMIYQILQALSALHNRGYVHRDIKPENILFDFKEQKRLLVVLSDCDGVSPIGQEASDMVGTYSTMSPEACKPHVLNSAEDIYSLGRTWLILFEIFYQRRSYKNRTEEQCCDDTQLQGNIRQFGLEQAIEEEVKVLIGKLKKVPENDLRLIAKMLVGLIETLPNGTLKATRPSCEELLADPLWGDTPGFCQ
jgi:serine/threonine protein kinase